jgi:hypothetical protein
MNIDVYRKDDDIRSQFSKYNLKKLIFKNNFIFISAKKDSYIWHNLDKDSIKELYCHENIIYIDWQQLYGRDNKEKKFLIKLVFKDPRDYITFKYYIKLLFY